MEGDLGLGAQDVAGGPAGEHVADARDAGVAAGDVAGAGEAAGADGEGGGPAEQEVEGDLAGRGRGEVAGGDAVAEPGGDGGGVVGEGGARGREEVGGVGDEGGLAAPVAVRVGAVDDAVEEGVDGVAVGVDDAGEPDGVDTDGDGVCEGAGAGEGERDGDGEARQREGGAHRSQFSPAPAAWHATQSQKALKVWHTAGAVARV
ncbi:MAG: hypothetical protein H6745_33710 [Deltaproteobacteria bacterium]|nr:hypothetical protein [Deltaproteobacteria bacterium]